MMIDQWRQKLHLGLGVRSRVAEDTNNKGGEKNETKNHPIHQKMGDAEDVR